MKSRKKNGSPNSETGHPKSVKGLANIAALVLPVAVAAAPKPAPAKNTAEGIVAKTVEAGGFSCGDAKLIGAAVREAMNLGHALAVNQNSMVEELLEKQYKARTDLTMPAVVAAVMEQLGMSEMLLDLDNVATVFTRCRLEQSLVDESVAKNYIDYKLRYLADDAAGDATFALKP